MLECLLAIFKSHVDSKIGKDVVLESLLTSQLDEENPQYLSFGIPDAAIHYNLRQYLDRHGEAIVAFVNSEPNGAPIPATPKELTALDLARYLSFRGQDTQVSANKANWSDNFDKLKCMVM